MSKTKKKVVKKIAARLPNKLSDLIDLAVDDLSAVEKMKRYAVNMSDWHVPTNETISDKCEVCFAGSVMARTCGLSPDVDGYNYMNSRGLRFENKMLALDSVRRGYVETAIDQCFGGGVDHCSEEIALASKNGIVDFEATEYSENPTVFKSEMRGLAARLRYAGL